MESCTKRTTASRVSRKSSADSLLLAAVHCECTAEISVTNFSENISVLACDTSYDADVVSIIVSKSVIALPFLFFTKVEWFDFGYFRVLHNVVA